MFSSNTSQVSEDANYIESCFSTYLYTGNGSTQTITNGIDLSGKGGLVWLKSRGAAGNNTVLDTVRGANHWLETNKTDADSYSAGLNWSFNNNGYTIGTDVWNGSGATFASWTFRKQPKFFDVVTWTGDGIAGRVIPHNLGSVPGCVIGKRTSATSDWTVYHRSLNGGTNPDQYQVLLNTTAAQSGPGAFLLAAAPTSTGITLVSAFNQIGVTYVAYLFAHDAGGFGLTGTDNVISCGSFTTTSGINSINLGYEPQWVLIKQTNAAQSWWLMDTMRGFSVTSYSRLFPDQSSAESVASGPYITPTATGFTFDASIFGTGNTYIYIAIRRGPMKVPTDGTKVYGAVSRTGTDANATISSLSFPPDTLITKNMSGTASPIGAGWLDRLRGLNNFLIPSATSAEDTVQTDILRSWNMNGATLGPDANTSRFNWSGNTYINWFFRRAPGFFDEVCYTGTGAARTVAHNLAAAPEMMIVKKRSSATASDWYVYHSGMVDLTYPNPATQYIRLNLTNNWVRGSSGAWNNTQPTSSVFSLGDTSATNASGQTFVAYLFATLAGVSKVGSYTGTGTTQQINCGFTAGARFVLIKRTDSTGDWYVWDSARGIVAGNDPYLLLNSTAAEVTTTDYVDTFSAGFEISSTAPAAINASGGTFIYLAIA